MKRRAKRRQRRNPKAYHNLETRKSPFGNWYIGYGNNGLVFKVTGESGDWIAEPASNVPFNKGKPYMRLRSYSLRGMSDKLAALPKLSSNPRRRSRRRAR